MQNDDNRKTDVVAATAAPLPSTTSTYYTAEYEENVQLRDYWHVLKKRKWWVLGVAGGVIVATICLILFMTPIWEGKVTLQITQDKGESMFGSGSGSMDPLGQMTGSSDLDRFYKTQYAILSSPTLAYGLIDALNLKEHISYKNVMEDNPDDPPEVIRQKYAKKFLKHLKVDPIKNSYLVDIIFHSTDKALAQKVPEALQREYLKLCMHTREQSFAMMREWLDDELSRTAKKLEISEKNAIVDGQKGDFLGIDIDDDKTAAMNVVLQKYVQVGQLLTACQSDRASKEALFKQINEKGADAPVITNNPLIQGLRQQLIGLQGQDTGSSPVFGANFPDRKVTSATAKEIGDKLNKEIRRLETSVKADYEAALKAENLLQQEFNDAKAKMVDMENGLVDFHMLKRDLQTNQALYEGLLGRMKDASVAATMVPSNTAIINSSEMPYEPWLPKPMLFLVLAVVFGSMLGVGTALFLEHLDNSIKSAEELERISHIPSLGMIPMAENGALPTGSQRVETITHSDPRSQISEAISHIRSAIMLSTSSSPPQVIVITSCNPSEGKTTSTSNIAIGLTGVERKVLLIDCDLRKPRLHKVFKLSNRLGVTSHLTGGATLEQVIKPTEIENLHFMPAGPTPPNPNDLISSPAFTKMLYNLRQVYQHIVIDSPPVIGFADARTLAVLSDGVVLIFKHHSTTREAAKLAVQMLLQNNTQILGGVLTMVRKERMGHGAYYDHYKYYHKYYAKYNNPTEEESKTKGGTTSN
jgi:capsular exopolysaccharide synthesis family protein